MIIIFDNILKYLINKTEILIIVVYFWYYIINVIRKYKILVGKSNYSLIKRKYCYCT